MKSLLDVTVRQILRWPRGAVGLDPGRALSNANPDPAKRLRDRRPSGALTAVRSQDCHAGEESGHGGRPSAIGTSAAVPPRCLEPWGR